MSCRCKLRAKLMQQKRSADIARHSKTTLLSQQQKQRRGCSSTAATDNSTNSSSLLDLSNRSAVTELTVAADASSSKDTASTRSASRHGHKVSFGCVEVREYERSLESEFTDIPHSLSLSWKYEQHDAEPLPFVTEPEVDNILDEEEQDQREGREEGLTPQTRRRKMYRASFSSPAASSSNANASGSSPKKEQHDCVIRKMMSGLMSPRNRSPAANKTSSSTKNGTSSSSVSSNPLLKRLLRKTKCGDKIDCRGNSSDSDSSSDEFSTNGPSSSSVSVDDSLSNSCRHKLMLCLDGNFKDGGGSRGLSVYNCQPTTKEQRLTILQANGFTLGELLESESQRLKYLDDIQLWSHTTSGASATATASAVVRA
eukprot:CAMPEP_0113473880 /NCGR_PEP_ID=MMETSP0014_2-20120614/18282_1 /TAXON_ID=2857 /ORGANISM="Nitzschia sp." /LENGTH=369 /DNA_ID=CAMNT_0000366681 /DNA_START=588 /DNA_END=1697 /DNA_ORIENTATION=- /assembly_acc=CAM_ASM_000159